ncbi:MAG: CRISPR-associated protein Cas5 [Candidatus Latescibacteria bacterium ADurb.Bin168]|nr:MAG: CRISPR-associated protein Cas5 [Candidatus Latescibacteria bacterium ADurb.Bin168]
MQPKVQILKVWGELACFTNPVTKVERFSYPVITPSAARGIFDAIYCKPTEFSWQVTKVEMLEFPRYIALRRNEVKDKIPVASILKWQSNSTEPEPLWADGDRDSLGTDAKGRTQRQTMALKNVRYRLHGEIRPWAGFEDRLQGLESQFRRRASAGKCFCQPCFGCREFPAYFELVEPDSQPEDPVPYTADLGWMVYDVFDLSRPGTEWDPPSISLFRAQVTNGILHIPEYGSTDVKKP